MNDEFLSLAHWSVDFAWVDGGLTVTVATKCVNLFVSNVLLHLLMMNGNIMFKNFDSRDEELVFLIVKCS